MPNLKGQPPMKTILIKNGRVIDPAQGIDRVTNVLIEGPRVKAISDAALRADEVIDARGMVVTPGLIDMHVHLREPGREEEETIASGSDAAIHGGLTTVCCMPNTEPAIDNEAQAEFVFLQAERAGKANIYPIGAITKGRKGEELAEIGQLSRGGAVAFSDDGDPVANSDVMRRGLQYAKMFGKPIISHCEDKALSGKGIVNEGFVSMTLGLRGMPRAAEEVAVNRDIALAEMSGADLHIAHVSTAGSVDLIRRAKSKGIKVTCEATPHHFSLTDECLRSFDPNFKMNPPLRTCEDVGALRTGLQDGTIDAIASDHAPHSPEEKDVEFSLAPFGVIGMETLLPITISELVHAGILTLPQAIEKLTVNPARILGLSKGTLAEGADADISIIDIQSEWAIDPARFKSKSRNCPFAGRKVRGRAVKILVRGKVFDLGGIQ